MSRALQRVWPAATSRRSSEVRLIGRQSVRWSGRQKEWLCEPCPVRGRVDEYHDDHVRHRPADQEVHRAAQTDQGCDRGTQFRQIPTGGGKERGRGATRGGDGKTHSIQGKHRAGAKVLRQSHTIHAGNGYDPATCGLEIVLASRAYEYRRAQQCLEMARIRDALLSLTWLSVAAAWPIFPRLNKQLLLVFVVI